MILCVRNVKTVIVLCFICSVTCFPRLDEKDDSEKTDTNDKQINNKTKVKNQQAIKNEKHNLRLQDGEQSVSPESEVQRESELGPDYDTDGGALLTPKPQNLKDEEPQLEGFVLESNKYSKKTHEIIGNIEERDGDIIGEIIIPSDSASLPDTDGNNGNNNVVKQNPNSNSKGNTPKNEDDDDDAITGTIEIDDDNIEGSFDIPDDSKKLPFAGNSEVNNKKGSITGSIQVDDDDGNIEGSVDLPDDSIDGSNNVEKKPGDGITGDINLNEDNIEGTIEIDDDIIGNPDTNNGDYGSFGGDISGNIEISDGEGGIEGEINIHDDENDSNIYQGDPSPGGDITGNIDISDGHIEGSIDIGDDGGDYNGDADSFVGDISGNIEISDGESIEGEIRIHSGEGGSDYKPDKNDDSSPESKPSKHQNRPSEGQDQDEKTCWMTLDSSKYLDALDELDAKYRKARQEYQNEIGPEFNKKLMEVLLSSQGKAHRAIHQAQGDPKIIPAGLNLGGYGLMRMRGSLLLFHRLKLRNDTQFRVNFLQADLMSMSLVARLSLHDLHLQGAYERTTTEGDLGVLFFLPNYGELNILLKDVAYKMEGRLRMLNNRLMIELINSEIVAKDVLVTYTNTSSSMKVSSQDNIENFVDRLKSDLDLWLKDYFNDYLMYFGIVGGKNTDIQVYEKQKTIKVNEYADFIIKGIKKRIRDMGLANIRLPHYTIISAILQQVKMKSGVLRGLDSMYRRSVATTKKENKIRKVDTIVGFSNLKVEFQYEAILGSGQPVVAGTLVLSADELTAHFELTQADGSTTVNIDVDTIVQLKSEALTVEGPASRLIANFKYILENPIIAVMTNILKHNIKMLKTLPACAPKLWGENGRNKPLAPYKSRFNVDTPKKPVKTPTNEGGSKNVQEVPPDPATSDDDGPPFTMDEFRDREEEFIKKDEDDEWADYVFSKNDTVEIEAPIDGKVEKLKLERNENFVLSKVP